MGAKQNKVGRLTKTTSDKTAKTVAGSVLTQSKPNKATVTTYGSMRGTAKIKGDIVTSPYDSKRAKK